LQRRSNLPKLVKQHPFLYHVPPLVFELNVASISQSFFMIIFDDYPPADPKLSDPRDKGGGLIVTPRVFMNNITCYYDCGVTLGCF
jgi:hypothetical protein